MASASRRPPSRPRQRPPRSRRRAPHPPRSRRPWRRPRSMASTSTRMASAIITERADAMKLPLLMVLLLAATLPARAAEPAPGASVESLLAAAREGSPDLRMARLEAEAARERIQPAGALPDPVLRIELENITRNGSQGATLSPSQVGDTKYTLMQPLPFWGKRDLKRDVASAEAEQASGRAAEAWSEVAARIKGLYAQYWLAGQSLQLMRENIELTRRLEQVAQARYAGGLAAQQ